MSKQPHDMILQFRITVVGHASSFQRGFGKFVFKNDFGNQLRLTGQFFADRQARPPQSANGNQLVELMWTLQPILSRESHKRYSHSNTNMHSRFYKTL